MTVAFTGQSSTHVQISKATRCCAGGFVQGVAIERIFLDWAVGQIANQLRSAHHKS